MMIKEDVWMKIEQYEHTKIKYIYPMFGKWYQMDTKDKELTIGSVFFDGRTREYIQIETEADLMRYSCLAPESYIIMKEFNT